MGKVGSMSECLMTSNANKQKIKRTGRITTSPCPIVPPALSRFASMEIAMSAIEEAVSKPVAMQPEL